MKAVSSQLTHQKYFKIQKNSSTKNPIFLLKFPIFFYSLSLSVPLSPSPLLPLAAMEVVQAMEGVQATEANPSPCHPLDLPRCTMCPTTLMATQ